MGGRLPLFKADEISLVDIDELIDIGKRFDLKAACNDGEVFDIVEEFLNNGEDKS